MSQHDDWVNYPVGKLGRGAWCEECKRYTVRNSTCDLIAVRGGKILLYRRKRDPQKWWWALPAGYVEWGETLEECVRRELREELRFGVGKLRLLGVYSEPKRDLDGRQNIAHCFVGEVSGKMKKDTSEVGEVRWFELDELPEKIAFDHRQMIDDYKKKIVSEK